MLYACWLLQKKKIPFSISRTEPEESSFFFSNSKNTYPKKEIQLTVFYLVLSPYTPIKININTLPIIMTNQWLCTPIPKIISSSLHARHYTNQRKRPQFTRAYPPLINIRANNVVDYPQCNRPSKRWQNGNKNIFIARNSVTSHRHFSSNKTIYFLVVLCVLNPTTFSHCIIETWDKRTQTHVLLIPQKSSPPSQVYREKKVKTAFLTPKEKLPAYYGNLHASTWRRCCCIYMCMCRFPPFKNALPPVAMAILKRSQEKPVDNQCQTTTLHQYHHSPM